MNWYRKMMIVVFLLKRIEKQEKRTAKRKQKVLDWKNRIIDEMKEE